MHSTYIGKVSSLLLLCRGPSIKEVGELGSVAGPVIQANGRLTFEDDLRSGGLLCLHSEPASALSLPTVWSLLGNPGMARC